MKKFNKPVISIFIFFALMIIPVIFAVLFTQTAIFRSFVLNVLNKEINNYLTVDFSIHKLEGNFFSNLEFHNIVLSRNDKDILNIPLIAIDYNLKKIFQKKIEIKGISIISPQLYLWEENDEWNIEKLFKTGYEEEVEAVDAAPQKFDWNIKINSLIISQLNAAINPAEDDDLLPYKINISDLEISASIEKEDIEMELIRFKADFKWTAEHILNVDKFVFKAFMSDNDFYIDNIIINTDNAVINAKSFSEKSMQKFNFISDIRFLNLNDLAYFIPEINSDMSFGITSEIKYCVNDINGEIKLFDELASIDMKLAMHNPFLNEKNELGYAVEMNIVNFEPYIYLSDSDLIPSFHLNGFLNLSGNTLDLSQGKIDFSIGLNDIYNDKYIDIYIDSINFSGQVNNNSLNSDLSVSAKNIADIKADIFFDNISELQGLSFKGEFFNLNLENILSDTIYHSNLNFNLTAYCSDIFKSPADVSLSFLSSSIFDIDFEELLFDGLIFRDGSVDLEFLRLVVFENILEVKGKISSNQYMDLIYSLNLTDISSLIIPFYDEFENIITSGNIEGSVKGELEDLIVKTDLNLHKTVYDELICERVYGNILLNIKDDTLWVEGDLQFENINYLDYEIERISIKGDYSYDTSKLLIEIIESPELRFKMGLDIYFDDEFILTEWEQIDIVALEDLWRLSKDKATIEYKNNSLLIDDLIISSENQTISFHGIISFDDTSDFKVKIDKLDIIPFVSLFDFEILNSGILNSSLKLSGPLEKPEISADLIFEDLSIYGLNNFLLNVNIEYDPNKELTKGIFNASKENLKLFEGSLSQSMKLSFDAGITINEDSPGIIIFKSTALEIINFQGLTEDITEISGFLKADLKIENPFSNIKMDGFAEIYNAGFNIPELGTVYRDISFQLIFSDDKLKLKNMNLKSAQGTLNASGFLVITNEKNDNLYELDLNLYLNSFPLVSNKGMDIICNSQINLTGSLSHPVFSGFVNIPRGRINLDYVLKNEYSDGSETPLLLQAGKINEIEDDIVVRDVEQFFDLTKLKGELSVKSDRNFWVRSSDMNIEMSGNLKIVKRDAEFELFGIVKVIRGYYEFFGKRFQIDKGEILFSGGKNINPDFTISAIYSFRGSDMTRKKLRLLVSGTLAHLDISFELDNRFIEQTDAISYLLFGRTFDKLTQSEKTQSTNHAFLLGGALANRLTEQLTSIVGKRFQLDHIEFSSDAATSQIGFEVGKYLTDDLFVSFKKDFNLGDTNEHVYEEIMFEYELTRFLFLQGIKSNSRTTGIDFIWRFQWR